MAPRPTQTQQGTSSRKADSRLKVRPQQRKPSGIVKKEATSAQTPSSTGSTSKTLTTAVDNTNAATKLKEKKVEFSNYDPNAFQQWLKKRGAEAAAMDAEDEARKKAIAARRKQEAAEKKLQQQARAARYKAAERALVIESLARDAKKKHMQSAPATTQKVQAQPKRLRRPSPKPVKREESSKPKKKSKQPVKDEAANEAVAQMTTESDSSSEPELPSIVHSTETPSSANNAELTDNDARSNKENNENALREELESTVLQLSESQRNNLEELVKHYYDVYKIPYDEGQEVEIDDVPLPILKHAAVWVRAQLSNDTDNDNPPSVEANQVDTSPATPSKVLNENGKRPLDDAESESHDSHAQESKRARRSESPKIPVQYHADDISASGVISAVNEPITALGTVIDETISKPIIKGELEETPKPSEVQPMEQEIKSKVSKRKFMDDDHLPQPQSWSPAKKPKLSREAEAMRNQSNQATAEPQAEPKDLKQDDDVKQPDNTPQGSPPVVNTQIVAAEEAADNADATNGDESKTKEESGTKAQQTSAQNGDKSKEETSSTPVPFTSSKTENNKQPEAAHNAQNEVTDPIVPKKPAQVAHNSNNSNPDVKTKAVTKKSTSKTKAASTTQNTTVDKNSATMSKTHNTTTSKTSSIKNADREIAATAQRAPVKKAPVKRDLEDITLGSDEEDDEDIQPKKGAKTVRKEVNLKGEKAVQIGKDGAEDENANIGEDGEATSSPAPNTTGTQPHDDNAPASPVRAPATQPERKKGVAYPTKPKPQMKKKPAPKRENDVRRFLLD